MIEQLLTMLQATIPSYEVVYEEAAMMNIKADAIRREKGFVYVEEFRNGQYVEPRFGGWQKRTRMEIYFGRFCDMHIPALEREHIREQIEQEAVLPFLNKWKENRSVQTETIQFSLSTGRFDSNEVTICLTMTILEEFCL